MRCLVAATQVSAFRSFLTRDNYNRLRATSKTALFLFSVAALLAGGAPMVCGQTPTPTCVPVAQGFDDISTLPGAGWVQINHSQPGPGITNWFQGSTAAFTSQSGAPNSYIAANYDNGTGTSTLSNWLLTQPVTLQNGFMLTFWTRTVTAPALPDRLQVRMSTNGTSTNVGTTATDVGDLSTLLLDNNTTYKTIGYPNVWTQFTVSVTGVPTMTTGRLAFRYF